MSEPARVGFFDAHNHLQDAWLQPHRSQVFADLAKIPLRAAVVNGTCESDWADVTALAREHAFVFPSYGLHPWYVGNASPQWRDTLQRQLDANPAAGLGEIGLDRWILERARSDDPRLAGLRRASLDEQLVVFSEQLALATERNVPVTIHCLEAWGALANVLRSVRLPARGFLLHAFSGSSEMVREFAALGAYFSFNGYFLGERHVARRDVFKNLPADRLLAETDAPAMPLPPTHRRHHLPGLADNNPVNHPANIDAVYAGLAALRSWTSEELEAQIEHNFRRWFTG